MPRLSSLATAAALALLLLTGTAFAQATAPAPSKSEMKAPTPEEKKARSAASLECSKQADAKGLHGKERRKFRKQCMKDIAEKGGADHAASDKGGADKTK